MSSDGSETIEHHDLEEALAVARRAALGVGERLSGSSGAIAHESKRHPADLVTELDVWAEESIRGALASFDQTIPVVGEETNPNDVIGLRWLVDPIDGTQHFVRGLPFASTQIALAHGDTVLVAVINLFSTGDCFAAARGLGSKCNGVAIRVSNRDATNAFIGYESRLATERSRLVRSRLELHGFWILKTLSAGYEYVLVASGRTEARVVIDGFGRSWDHAPGLLLVTEAGGTVAPVEQSHRVALGGDFVVGSNQIVRRIKEVCSVDQ